MKIRSLSLIGCIFLLGCTDKTFAQKWTDNSGREVPVTVSQNKDTIIYDFGTIGINFDSFDGSISASDNDASEPRLVLPLGHTGYISDAFFSPDGKYVVTTSSDETARVWDVLSGRELRVISGLPEFQSNALLSLDGKSLLVEDILSRSTATIYDVASGNTVQSFRVCFECDDRAVVALSPDANYLVTHGFDEKTIRIWNVADRSELQVASGPSEDITSVAFSTDGKWLLTASNDSTARILDVVTGTEIHVFTGHKGPVNNVVLSHAKQLAMTSSKDEVRIWDISSGNLLQLFSGYSSALKCVDFSPDDQYVLTTCSDSTAIVCNVATGKEHFCIKGLDADDPSAKFSTDGKMVIIASDKSIRFWDVLSGKELYEMSIRFNGELEVLSHSNEMKYILVSTPDEKLTIRELASGKEWPLYTGLVDDSYTVCVSPNGKWVFSANNGETARMWDVSTGRDVQVFSGHPIPVVTAAFSPDGQKVITGGAIHFASSSEKEKIDGTARIWDVSSGKLLFELKGAPSNLECTEFISDGKNVLTTNEDGSAVLWDALKGDRLRVLSANDSGAITKILSTQGQFVLYRFNYFDTENYFELAKSVVQVYDIFTNKKTCVLTGQEGEVNTAVMSSNQRWILTTGSDGSARIWNAVTGEQVHVLFKLDPFVTVTSVLFSSDGNRIVSITDDGTIRVWDVASGAEIQRFYGSRGVEINKAIFSPDGAFIVSSHDGSSCQVYNVSTGDLHMIVKHSGQWFEVSFSPDGKYLITSGSEGVTVVSDLARGKILYKRIQLKGGDWVIFDDQGRIDGSPKGMELLYFVQGMKVVLDDQLFNRSYVPQLVETIFREVHSDSLMNVSNNVAGSLEFVEVSIGNQVWMGQNLNALTFRNGDTIPCVVTPEEWVNAGLNRQPAWCYFEHDPVNGLKSGKLYNWYALNDPRGLAPEGWHVPTDSDWTVLSDYLGGTKEACLKMKSQEGWLGYGNGSDEVGWTALPGGCRYDGGTFSTMPLGYWWSSTERGAEMVWCRMLSSYSHLLERRPIEKATGLSVRCVKD